MRGDLSAELPFHASVPEVSVVPTQWPVPRLLVSLRRCAVLGEDMKVRTFNYKPLGGAIEALVGRAAAGGRLWRTSAVDATHSNLLLLPSAPYQETGTGSRDVCQRRWV